MNKITNLFSFICYQGAWIFFILLSYIGIRYEGSSESFIYAYFWALIAFFAMLSYFSKVIKRKISSSYIVAILIIVSLSFLYYIQGLQNHSFFKIHLAMCSPSIILGIYFAEKNLITSFSKNYLWLFLISLIPLINVFYEMITLSAYQRYVLDSGAGTLQVGYSAASFFVFLFYYLQVKKEHSIYDNTLKKHKILTIFSSNLVLITSLSFMFLVAVATGSRGPLVSIIMTVITMEILKNGFNTKLFKALVIATIISLVLVYLVYNVEIDALRTPLARIKSLIDGILVGDTGSASSGRDRIYHIAWDDFKENPVFGLGFAGFLKKYGYYVHNFFLEMLVDYGLIGATLLFSFFVYIFKPLFKKIKNDPNMLLFMSIFVLQFFGLMFSGSFLTSAIMWFYFGYALFFKMSKSNN